MDMGVSYVDQSRVSGRPFYHGLKRIFDFLASAVALILLSPLFLILAIKIKAEDGGPVFYSQIRIGKDEKPFRIYKFRSMVVNAEKMKWKEPCLRCMTTHGLLRLVSSSAPTV